MTAWLFYVSLIYILPAMLVYGVSVEILDEPKDDSFWGAVLWPISIPAAIWLYVLWPTTRKGLSGIDWLSRAPFKAGIYCVNKIKLAHKSSKLPKAQVIAKK